MTLGSLAARGPLVALGLAVTSLAGAQGPFDARSTILVQGIGSVATETDYVPNVVQAENGLASFEALKAQAVAARTYAYFQMRVKGFLADGTSDQVYSNGSDPDPLHVQAARATEGEILWVNDNTGQSPNEVLVAAFYVAGSIPSGPFDPDAPGVISQPGDPDPTATQKWVTFPYANDLFGEFNRGTPLGFRGSVSTPNWPNRGAMSQNGSDYLSDRSVGYLDILKYYYGADIQVRTATTAGSAVGFGRKVLAGFDDYSGGIFSSSLVDGNEGVFHRSPTYSAETTPNLTGSDAARDGSQAHEGSHSQRIDIVYDESSGEEFFLRHIAGARYSDTRGTSVNPTRSGDFSRNGVVDAADYTVWRDNQGQFDIGNPADFNGDGFVDIGDYTLWAGKYNSLVNSGVADNAGEPVANVQFEAIGSVGLWLKSSTPGLEVSLAIDDATGGERGVRTAVVADGQWRRYEWRLDSAIDWEAWAAGGNGVIDGVTDGGRVSLDSVQFFGATDATVFLDTVYWDPAGGSPPSATVPEPAGWAASFVGALGMAARRRRVPS